MVSNFMNEGMRWKAFVAVLSGQCPACKVQTSVLAVWYTRASFVVKQRRGNTVVTTSPLILIK